MCVSFTTNSCHAAPPVALAWPAAMGNIWVVPHQALAASDKAISQVSHAAKSITAADLGPTLCGSLSNNAAMTINKRPLVTNWTWAPSANRGYGVCGTTNPHSKPTMTRSKP